MCSSDLSGGRSFATARSSPRRGDEGRGDDGDSSREARGASVVGSFVGSFVTAAAESDLSGHATRSEGEASSGGGPASGRGSPGGKGAGESGEVAVWGQDGWALGGWVRLQGLQELQELQGRPDRSAADRAAGGAAGAADGAAAGGAAGGKGAGAEGAAGAEWAVGDAEGKREAAAGAGAAAAGGGRGGAEAVEGSLEDLGELSGLPWRARGQLLRALLAELGAQDEEDGARAQAGSCFLTLPGESPARPRATSPVEFV